LQPPIALPIFSRDAVSERPIIEESKLVLRIERQLDNALEKLIPGNAAKRNRPIVARAPPVLL
jgi:hypothetical protein